MGRRAAVSTRGLVVDTPLGSAAVEAGQLARVGARVVAVPREQLLVRVRVGVRVRVRVRVGVRVRVRVASSAVIALPPITLAKAACSLGLG